MVRDYDFDMETEPKNPYDWFRRRIYLTDQQTEFREIRTKLYKEGKYKSYQGTFWEAARELGYKDVHTEKELCQKLEAQLLKTKRHRARTAKKEMQKEQELFDQMSELAGASESDGDYQTNVQWVFENFARFIKLRDGASNQVVNVDALQQEAPSLGAVGLMYFAASNMGAFQQIASKVLSKTTKDDTGDEKISEPVSSLDEIRRAIQDATQ